MSRVQGTGLVRATVVHPDGSAGLRRVSVVAGPGELLVVLGPSGSGKSLLLRAVAGVARVTEGDVLVAGQRVNREPPHLRRVALMSQAQPFFSSLDVEGNMSWGLGTGRGVDPSIRRRVLDQALGLGLGRLLHRAPQTLSAGERNRVGVARVLSRQAVAYLFDEPLANADPVDRPALRRRIQDTVRQLGATALYVTHDQDDALAIADRVAVLQAGAVRQIGPPAEIFRRPDDLFVAGFVGSPPIGLLPARLVVSGGLAGFQVGARTLPLWAPPPAPLQHLIGQEMVLGVRWPAVTDAELGSDPEQVSLPGRAVSVQRTGPELIVTVEVAAPPVTTPGADPVAPDGRAQLRARFSGRSRVRRGDPVLVGLDATAAHVFDIRTGRALHHPPA